MYDLSLHEGEVLRVIEERKGADLLEVVLNGRIKAKAVNYTALTGKASKGDRVLMNTTAVELDLGTGGSHFVCANLSADHERNLIDRKGHIMKMRYTPFQVRTLCVEEAESPYHSLFKEELDLDGYPVVLLPLHSLLAPLVICYKWFNPEKKVVYLMTEGGSLTLDYSRMVSELKEKGLIDTTITCGHTYGGDLEAVNIFTGLITARKIACGDLVVIGMGPGITGTGTRLGFSGTEMALVNYALKVLQGRSIFVPRISFADRRQRHYLISHHTLTLVNELIDSSVDLVFPEDKLVRTKVMEEGISSRHNLFFYHTHEIKEILDNTGYSFYSMGRNLIDDPLFFVTAGLAVYRLKEILEE